MILTIHYFPVILSEDEWIRYYRGEIEALLVHTTRGLSVSISAHHFQKFTCQVGLYGFFKLTVKNNKFVSLEKLA
tara:strand:+ start:322 stop:546 length:225 start_codon:yes stop_codon:yes gene_type:complete